MQRKLPVVDNNEYTLLGYNTVLAIVFLFPIIALTGELKVVLEVFIVYHNGTDSG